MRLKSSAVREIGLTAPQLASSLRAYVNGETATYWTTPDGNQVEVVLRLNEGQRERVAQLRQLPVAFAKDGTPIALDTAMIERPTSLDQAIAQLEANRDRFPDQEGWVMLAGAYARAGRRAVPARCVARARARPRCAGAARLSHLRRAATTCAA